MLVLSSVAQTRKYTSSDQSWGIELGQSLSALDQQPQTAHLREARRNTNHQLTPRHLAHPNPVGKPSPVLP